MPDAEYTRYIHVGKATDPRGSAQQDTLVPDAGSESRTTYVPSRRGKKTIRPVAANLDEDYSSLTTYAPRGNQLPRQQSDDVTCYSAGVAPELVQPEAGDHGEHTVFIAPGGTVLNTCTDARKPLNRGFRLHRDSYEIESVLGRGGFGITYLANDVNLDLRVVIKENMPQGALRDVNSQQMLPPDAPKDREAYAYALDNFYKEARMIARIGARSDNPHIVRVKACFKELNTAYYVMDHVEGVALTSFCDAPIAPAMLMEVLLAMLDGLCFLHKHRICHLDIKPANILISSDTKVPVLIDFGAACHLDSSDRRYERVYSEGYSPPEQVAGLAVNETADIYALGATAYRLMVGERYTAGAKLLSQIPGVAKMYSRDLLLSIEKAMALKPQERWQSAEEWMRNLRSVNPLPSRPKAAPPVETELERLQREADAGDPGAQYRLGRAFEYGECGARLNQALAIQWYQKSAEQDYTKAGIAWLRMAKVLALGGNCRAQLCVAHVLQYGKYGIAKDLSEARRWYQMAADHGDEQARKALGKMTASANSCIGKVVFLCLLAMGCFIGFLRHRNQLEHSWDAETAVVAQEQENLERGVTHEENKEAVCAENAVNEDDEFLQPLPKLMEEESGESPLERETAHGELASAGQHAPVEEVTQVKRESERAEVFFQEGQRACSAGEMLQAYELYRQAAGLDHAPSQCILGEAYYKGEFMPQDYAQAVKWFRKAARQGNAEAQNWLGVCYSQGHGVKQNYEKAAEWYRKSAQMGNAEAQYNLGACYLHGLGVRKNIRKALEWTQKASAQGQSETRDSELRVRHAVEAEEKQRRVERETQARMSALENSANAGDAAAQVAMGINYYNGRGVPQSYEKAAGWFRKAASQDNAWGETWLGWCYEKGHGVKMDKEEAFARYKSAAKKGHAEAQYYLGLCYAYGKGCGMDKEEAGEWFERAAANGYEKARASYNDLMKLKQLGIW